ncbi:hypothetical protein A9Q99_05075 [Gammaproteobacteria bacterium 45_16_T64]|nr:hypothetical protein A9Q99_05075 [Gammaproteobacteria bacterium 45_16_T64]
MKKQSLALTLSVLSGTLFSGGAWAHGTMETPISRDYQCFQEGPENPQSAACKEAVRIGGTQPLYDWNAISQNAAGDDQAFVPDGMLCSGGNVKYRGLDLARTDWQKTPIQGDVNGEFEFVFLGTAPHATKRWDFYITKDNYDTTKALTWNDLEPAPFCQHGNVPLENGRYSMSCELPADKDGDHVIYNIWERIDSPETFYTCMDVSLTGTGNGNGGGQSGNQDDNNSDGNTDGNTDDNTTDDGSGTEGNSSGNGSDDNSSSLCAADGFVSGASYNAGDIVNNAGGTYECVIGGWCSSSADWAYEPGEGLYWTQAWKAANTCDDIVIDDPDGPGGNNSDNNTGNNTDNNTDNGNPGDNSDPGGSTTDNGNASNGCNAPAFVSGKGYLSGDVAFNAGDAYECVIGGWCSSSADWAYAPGEGLYWSHAWKLAGSCQSGNSGSEGSSDDDGHGHSDDGTNNHTDDTAGNDDTGTENTGNENNDNVAEEGTGEESGAAEESTEEESTAGNEEQETGTDSGSVSGRVVASYFVEWGVYGRNYHVMDMPADKLTHILYGFIPVCGPNQSLQQANPSGYSALVQQCAGKQDYEVVVHDKFAALEKSYPGDKWDDPIRGNFGQLIKLKAANPGLKVIPSIGGWTLSDPFFSMASNAKNRDIFVTSVIDFLKAYEFFDGADIDWEFPGGGGANASLGSAADSQAYVELMRDLRLALDNLESETGREYELTSAIGTGPSKIDAVNYADAQMYMDYIFAMTYDFYGAWSGELGHHAGLYDYPENLHDGFNGASAIVNLIEAGVPSNKLVLGAAMYGRGWKGVTGAQFDKPLGGQGNGAAKGTWENGVLDYKDIVANYLGGTNGAGINGFTYYYDETAEAPYLWNPATGTLISYENPRSVIAKGQYVKQYELGGLFSWEIDADNGDIIDAMVDSMK